MRVPSRLLLAVALTALVAASCGDAGTDTAVASGPFPAGSFTVVASSDLAVGRDRLLLGVVGPDNQRLGAPHVAVSFELFPEEHPDELVSVPATFTWAIPERRGLYRAEVDFNRAGTWLVRVVPADGPPLGGRPLTVRAEPLTPAVGEPAPPSETPTGADFPLDQISTDPTPEPRFYELSVAEAVASGRPTVVVFSTPLYCATAVCGPTLDELKEVAAGYPDVNWVHVEIFTNLDDPDNRQIVPAVQEWGLATEPWVFVVDAAGVVQARFEGVIDPDEIEAELGAPTA